MSAVSGGRVLVVDDDPQVLSLLRRILLVEGFEPDICEDGESALVKAQLEPPDLMVLDVMLPGLDGLEVCRRMRQMSEAPILMLMRFIYPVAGLIWGLVLYQAAEQGYLPLGASRE